MDKTKTLHSYVNNINNVKCITYLKSHTAIDAKACLRRLMGLGKGYFECQGHLRVARFCTHDTCPPSTLGEQHLNTRIVLILC